jgi:Family of unknown function (DUF6519)
MRGDFTRNTFDPNNQFSRVLGQQGRVTLDADSNEQTAILLHYLRTLAQDLIGPYAAPCGNNGFQLSYPNQNANGFTIGTGRYYVDGILVENDDASCTYGTQPSFTPASGDPILKEIGSPSGNFYWIYLDVWERYITWIEDSAIREVALNGPDTCGRAQVIWQVKALPFTGANAGNNNPTGTAPNLNDCGLPLKGLAGLSAAIMAAQVDPGKQSTDPCVLSPTAQYRGPENQLYRVEIHQGGTAGANGATFKWSRDNGSVVTPWLGWDGKSQIQVANTRGFSSGCWVELGDDSIDLAPMPGVLVLVTSVTNGVLTVDPTTVPSSGITFGPSLSNPKARRWDQSQNGAITLSAGAVPISEASATTPDWIDLEDGLQVQFTAGGNYRTGDYWWIPARVATGSIEWPQTTDSTGKTIPTAIPPAGVQHHYAPLGFVSWTAGQGQGQGFSYTGCLCQFNPSSNCFQRNQAP